MKKTLESKLNFKKITVLNLNQMSHIIGGVNTDDGDNRTRSMSSKVCDPDDNGN